MAKKTTRHKRKKVKSKLGPKRGKGKGRRIASARIGKI